MSTVTSRAGLSSSITIRVDAFPICLDTQDTDEIVHTVGQLAPVFAGINLEDTLAALTNALAVMGKRLSDVRLVMSGAGAAGTAVLRLLLAAGARDVLVTDADGVLHRDRPGLSPQLRWTVENTNPRGVAGTLRQALAGSDVFIGVSAPNILTGQDIATMAPGSVVFALADPVPEIDPLEASRHAAAVATGRSDLANQINNVLAFPGVFRGLLDAQSSMISTSMLLAASRALAGVVEDDERNPACIVPSVFHPQVTKVVAAAVERAARDEGLTGHVKRRWHDSRSDHAAGRE
jgi:malate dehydrogenase (oxaloacetate-decarboxylating)